MTMTTDRGLESLAQLQRYLDVQAYGYSEGLAHSKKQADKSPLSIALSREAGSGGAVIARAVGARLGWPVFDHELLDRIAEERGLSARLLKQLDERHISWLEGVVRAFCAPQSGRDGSYLRGLLELLASLGKVGHCVIVGRGAAQVLPADATLKVRVIAPHAFRVAEVEKRRSLPKEEAEHWVDTTDRERQRFIKQHFHVNAEDPLTYDLVLNSKRFGTDECAALIVQAAQALEAHAPVKVPAG